MLVDYGSGNVESDDEALAARVDKVVGRVMQALHPCRVVAE